MCRIYPLIFVAFVLSGCIGGTSTVQYTGNVEPRFAKLMLPITETQQKNHVIRVATGKNDKIIMEQHAFSGGRVTAIFDSRYPVTFYSANRDILNRIMESPFVVNFIGSNRLMGGVKKHDQTSIVNLSILNPDAGGTIRYALVTNPKKTKHCAVFVMNLHSTDNVLSSYLLGYQSTVIDGALCSSTRQKNAVAMEDHVQQFITAISIR